MTAVTRSSHEAFTGECPHLSEDQEPGWRSLPIIGLIVAACLPLDGPTTAADVAVVGGGLGVVGVAVLNALGHYVFPASDLAMTGACVALLAGLAFLVQKIAVVAVFLFFMRIFL